MHLELKRPTGSLKLCSPVCTVTWIASTPRSIERLSFWEVNGECRKSLSIEILVAMLMSPISLPDGRSEVGNSSFAILTEF